MRSSLSSSFRRGFAIVLLSFGMAACASQPKVKPDREKTYEVDGHEAQLAELENCRVTAFSAKNDLHELMIEIRVQNSSGAPIDLAASQFTLTGPAMKGETLHAVEPDAYFAKLTAEADNLEKRVKLPTWEGVDVLTQSDQDDKELRKLKERYEESEDQKRADLDRAKMLRAKEAALKPRLLKPTKLASGAETRGEILFPGPFAKKGKVTLGWQHPKCPATLAFVLDF